jgi:uncharacterized protein YegJ (DUF2314 family)
MKPPTHISRIVRTPHLAPLLLAFVTVVAVAVEPTNLDGLLRQAGQDRSTDEGQAYFEKFEDAIMPVFGKALEGCAETTPDTEKPATFVFVIGADGKVQRLLFANAVPFTECVSEKLEAIKTVPPPPRDNWVVAISASNHQHAEKGQGPAERTLHISRHDFATLEKAMAPAIAEAKATYPAARKKFLSGLPTESKFVVQVHLKQRDGKREGAFVEVDSIRDGQVSGTIETHLELVSEFKQGQHITFPEEEVYNWLIVQPDGSEVGNAVGKFLDSYKPK